MTVRRFMSVAAVLVAAGLVLAQQPASKDQPKKDAPAKKEPPKPAPGSLEDTLEKALRNSADIKVAESKVRDAEAELNRVRQQVLTRATAVHSDLNLAKRMLAVAETSLMVARNTSARVGPDGKDDVIAARTQAILAAEAMVEKHRGEVEKLETELKSLRGEFALTGHREALHSVAFSPDGRLIAGTELSGQVRIWDAKTGWELKYLDGAMSQSNGKSVEVVQTPMAERIRKFLETEVTFQEVLRADAALGNLVDGVLKTTKADIPIHKLPLAADARCEIDLEAKGTLPVGAILQLFEDNAPNVRIVIREYGLLVTTKDRVPEGAIRAVDFWKGKETKKADQKGSEQK
ncbi:MAG TPA: hypothetical protein VKD71_00350 [Gemmataceae bacterium]|nr:hypothetical protein [Gemmataceae bacterium]